MCWRGPQAFNVCDGHTPSYTSVPCSIFFSPSVMQLECTQIKLRGVSELDMKDEVNTIMEGDASRVRLVQVDRQLAETQAALAREREAMLLRMSVKRKFVQARAIYHVFILFHAIQSCSPYSFSIRILHIALTLRRLHCAQASLLIQ